MKRIRFTVRTEFEKFGRKHADNPVFEQGSEHTMRDDQADRWLKRGVAVLWTGVPDEVAAADPLRSNEVDVDLSEGDPAEADEAEPEDGEELD